MARLNVYVPDELAERARELELNVSALTQAAIAAEVDSRSVTIWLAKVPFRSAVSHDEALQALDEARDEFGAPA